MRTIAIVPPRGYRILRGSDRVKKGDYYMDWKCWRPTVRVGAFVDVALNTYIRRKRK